MNEQITAYLKNFRRSLRNMGFGIFPESKSDGMIIAERKKDGDIFNEYAVFDYRNTDEDGVVYMTMMYFSTRYMIPALTERLNKVCEQFMDAIVDYDIEHGFTGGVNGDFRLISEPDGSGKFRRITLYRDIEFSTIVLSPKYVGYDELAGMVDELISDYNEHARALYEIWLELGRRSSEEKNKEKEDIK